MKKLKQLLFLLASKIYIYILLFKLNNRKYTRVFIFDIDNTIANSWYSYNVNYFTSNKHRLASLPIFIKMRRLINVLYHNPNNVIFFLTARRISDYKTTFDWLKGQGFPLKYSNLFIVNSPHLKIKIISALKNQKQKIYYVDDLTYNHENGLIKFYEKDISSLNALSSQYNHIKYFGNYDIENFNNF